MSLIKSLALAIGALALTAIGPVFAQVATAAGPSTRPTVETASTGQTPPARGRRNRDATPAAGADDVRAAAQAHIVAAGLTCQLTEAVNPGTTADQTLIYEAACADAPGYILMAGTPPQSFNCLELAGMAATSRQRDPDADVGQQCVLAANQNGVAVIGGWARTAGVACTIDEAVAIGRSDADNMVYEVGCAGVDGYRLEAIGAGWDLKDCLQVASTGGTCHFTTAQEQADGFKTRLAGTDAAACDVTQVRLMGQNANGRFYEAKCAADGEGYIARTNTEGLVQQIYPCASAQRIGNGCILTPVPSPSEQ